MSTTSKIIKQIAREITQVLIQNNQANEMGAMIDAGEWSETGPDFRPLVERWGLTRRTLIHYCTIARLKADIWKQKYPNWNTYRPKHPWEPPMPFNPWEEIEQTLHCIFMAGLLQDHQDQPHRSKIVEQWTGQEAIILPPPNKNSHAK